MTSLQPNLLHTIDLTARLESSLRRLLSRKPSLQQSPEKPLLPHGEESTERRLLVLQEQNRELFHDNQKLSRQVVNLRGELRSCQKELAQATKHLKFLQGYNQDLKRQMQFWIKSSKEDRKSHSKRKETQGREEMIHRIAQLKRENASKEKSLFQLKQTLQTIQKDQSFHHKSKHQDHQDSFDLSNFENILIKNRKPSDYKASLKNPCTSCNYKRTSSASSLSKSRPSSKKKQHHKQSNLRSWHSRYLSHCDYPY